MSFFFNECVWVFNSPYLPKTNLSWNKRNLRKANHCYLANIPYNRSFCIHLLVSSIIQHQNAVPLHIWHHIFNLQVATIISYEARILQNGDMSVSDTDTPRLLSDTYPRSIGVNYFNLKYIFYRILIRYLTYTHRYL